ncbi:MAG TPA: flagellar biosynthesis protein FlgB [Terracidiphilus sp.]|jgi:flagellar basal-body rod protein FlgB
MQIETRLSDQLVKYLDLAVYETKLTAANMANIDTPGYRTRGFNFQAELRKVLTSIDTSSGAPVRVEDVDGLVSRPDGNNVSMDREGLQMSEAQLKFRTGVALVRLENQRVMDAIHADK